MTANNVGHPLDDKGNIQVDFVWGNMARQPNDVRTGTSATGTDIVTSTTTTNPVTGGSNRIVPGLDGHDAVLGAWAGYPSFSFGAKDTNGQYQGDPGEFGIDFVNPSIWATATQSSTSTATLTSVTIAAGSPNTLSSLRVGQPVFSTGYLAAGTYITYISGTTIGISAPPLQAMSGTSVKFNVDPVVSTTVSSASLGATSITVASASGISVGQGVAATGTIAAGTVVTSVTGTSIGLSLPLVGAMSSTTVKFGPDGAWVFTPYISVPNLLGLNGGATDSTVTLSGVSTVLGAYTAQDALRDAGYQNANVKVNGSAQSNTAITVTGITRTAGSTTAVLAATGAGAQYPVGAKVTVSSLVSPNTEFNGTWVVTANATNTFSITSLNSTAVSQSSLTGSVVGVQNTVFSQTDAAGANLITGTSDVTIKLYA